MICKQFKRQINFRLGFHSIIFFNYRSNVCIGEHMYAIFLVLNDPKNCFLISTTNKNMLSHLNQNNNKNKAEKRKNHIL